MSLRDAARGLNLVAMGGGTGLSTVLAGLKAFVGSPSPSEHASGRANEAWIESLSAIVTVSDDGGSSGRLRDELNILAPGDIRNCMVALSEDSGLLARLFRYRFPGTGALGGHSFGNLFLAALTAVTGDFHEAVRLSSEVLASKGRIYPATLTDVHLVAEFGDGSRVQGETRIAAANRPIRRLRLEPEHCLPLPEALAALQAADVITIGPGSLYTSILPNLLVSRVSSIIGESRGTKIFICNLMTQPGETDGFTAHKHLAAIKEHAPEINFDYVIVNDRPVTSEQAAAYHAEGAQQVALCDELFEETFGTDTRIVRADMLDEGEKVRHSPEKLARIIAGCAGGAAAELYPASPPERAAVELVAHEH